MSPCALILSGRFVHFLGTELGDSFRLSLFNISVAMMSWLPVVPLGPSVSVPPGPGLGADDILLLPWFSHRNFFTCKDMGSFLGMELGEPA